MSTPSRPPAKDQHTLSVAMTLRFRVSASCEQPRLRQSDTLGSQKVSSRVMISQNETMTQAGARAKRETRGVSWPCLLEKHNCCYYYYYVMMP